MPDIAVDVVLVPAQTDLDRFVSLSQNLYLESGNPTIVLDGKNCFPHVTLAMGIIEDTSIVELQKILEQQVHLLRALSMIGHDVFVGRTPKGEINSGINVQKTEEIQKIHETVLGVLKPLLIERFSIEALYPDPPPCETTLFWIRNFEAHSSHEKYEPHITIGFGELKNVTLPMFFTADRLAVFQLGNYCTCRKLLFDFHLGNK